MNRYPRQPGGAMIVGREEELARLRSFLREDAPHSAAVVLEGEAGIGKTTVFAAALDAEVDVDVRQLSARPSEPDSELAFSTLTDLLGPIAGDLVDGLPEPQRRAIAVALLEETDPGVATDVRAVSAGVQTLLTAACEQAPLLIAIDDAQWIDPSTDRVLGFALRRLQSRPIRLLLAVRRSDEVSLPPGVAAAVRAGPSETITIGALSLDDISSIVTEALGERPTRRERIEIHAQSGGNPFFAVELARAARRGDDRPTGLSLPVPKALREDLVRQRFAGLSGASREALLVAAATSRPAVQLVRAVVGEAELDEAMDATERVGVARIAGGEVRFVHPLYRSAIYADASRAHRHRIHAAIARVVEEPEERGRHLALSSDVPDEEVAGEIERAASIAGARGAPDAAADLLDHAIRLTPERETLPLARRLRTAGRHAFDAGDVQIAIELTLRAASLSEPGPARAAAFASLGEMELFVWRLGESRGHLEAALLEPNIGAQLGCAIHSQLFWTLDLLGDPSGAADHAERALALARTIDDRPTRARAFGAAGRARFLADGSSSEALEREAPELWEPIDGLPVHEWPRWLGEEQGSLWAADVSGSIERLSELLSRAEERGDEPSRLVLLCAVASAHRRTGDWSAGVAYAREAADAGGQLGGAGQELALIVWYEAAMGDLDAARLDADRCLERIADVANPRAALPSLTELADVELMLGSPGEACARLMAALGDVPSLGVGAPMPGWFVAADASLASGRLDGAEEIAAWLRERAETLDGSFVMGFAERIDGEVFSARGDLASAERSLELSLKAMETADVPFEIARSLLLLGDVRRRSGQKRLARQDLVRSRAIFGGLGASTWVAKVDLALGRITGRRPSMGELTDAELRVARLAAAGFRNREIAEQLFMSVRTVEGHLSNIYPKLGIRSRTELAAHLADS
jgi:DNA-binding CsgD family transcriptional regulator